jgi:hypothetical protein
MHKQYRDGLPEPRDLTDAQRACRERADPVKKLEFQKLLKGNLGSSRKVIVNHAFEKGNVDPPCSDISNDKNIGFALPKIGGLNFSF